MKSSLLQHYIGNRFLGLSAATLLLVANTTMVNWGMGENSKVSVMVNGNLPAGLVGYWTGDDTFEDVTGANNGTPFGGTGFTEGRIGRAFLLDGVDDIIEVGTLPGLAGAETLTVMAWVRADSTSAGRGIVGQWAPQFLLWAGTHSTGHFHIDEAHGGLGGSMPIPLGQWTHLAAVWRRSDRSMRLYFNGSLASSSNFGLATPLAAVTVKATIGSWSSDYRQGYVWPGGIDEVAIFTRDLSAAEIQRAMSQGVPIPIVTFTVSPAKVNERQPVTLTASAGDNSATMAKVEFFDGVTKLGEHTSVPFSLIATNLTVGKHSLTARVTDQKGVTTTSAVIRVIVNTPPTVTLSATPTTVNQGLPVTLTAMAGDIDGTVTKVEFFNGPRKIGEDALAPFSLTAGNLAGQPSLTARATDDKGTTTTSAVVRVTVNAPSPGTVAAWGYNSYSQTNVPAGLSGVIAVGAGEYHTAALKSNGTVVAWGDASHGQTNVPSGLNGVTAIAVGDYHTLALKNNGTVEAWGDNLHGQKAVPSGLNAVTAVAAGGSHSVAMRSDGTVVLWGNNSFDQTKIPAGLSGVVAIAAGNDHTVALKNDGTVVAWGAGMTNADSLREYGQSIVPAGLSDVVAVAAGRHHTMALKNDGTVVAWGYNHYGISTVPGGLSGVVAIAAGDYHNMALKGDGTVVAWGYNYHGQTNIPAGLSGVTAVAAGGSHAVAVVVSIPIIFAQSLRVVANEGENANLSVLAIGAAPLSYQWSQNGVSLTGATNATMPLNNVQPSQAGNYAVLITNIFGSVASKITVFVVNPVAGGTVAAWGHNDFGQTSVPAGLSGVTAIAAGGSHTVALLNDGTVVAWGAGKTRTDLFSEFGQSIVPAGLSGVVAIAAGDDHTVALRNDGTVVAWGRNDFGQATVPAYLDEVKAITAGGNYTVALKNDGSVSGWGWDKSGQQSVPADLLIGVVALAAGGEHALALKNDGTVVAWGWNGFGQSAVPANLSGVTAVAAGGNHSVALKSDGTVVSWGYNYYAQTNVPTGLKGVTAIAAGGSHTVALRNDGTLVSWGAGKTSSGSFPELGQSLPPPGLRGVTSIAAGDDHTVALVGTGSPKSLDTKPVISVAGVPAGIQGFRMKIQTIPGKAYRVEWSADLGTWKTLTTFVGTIADFDFVDDSARNALLRFYRVADHSPEGVFP